MIFQGTVRSSIEERRSRFIGVGIACHTLEAFQAVWAALKTEFADATHITYAYRIRENGALRIRAHDAAEPSGTAGRPILNHINGHDLMNSAILVVRYFGGIKLGAGGLARAYGEAARATIQAATLIPFILREEVTFSIAYDQQNQIERLLGELGAEILARTFSDRISYKITLPCGELHRIAHLRICPEIT